MLLTRRTVLTAASVGELFANRSGGSPMSVLVTAKADFEIDLKLYPPYFRRG
jgi:hypothetical protein